MDKEEEEKLGLILGGIILFLMLVGWLYWSHKKRGGGNTPLEKTLAMIQQSNLAQVKIIGGTS